MNLTNLEERIPQRFSCFFFRVVPPTPTGIPLEGDSQGDTDSTTPTSEQFRPDAWWKVRIGLALRRSTQKTLLRVVPRGMFSLGMAGQTYTPTGPHHGPHASWKVHIGIALRRSLHLAI